MYWLVRWNDRKKSEMNLKLSETKCEMPELSFKSVVKRNSKECCKLGEVTAKSRNVRNMTDSHGRNLRPTMTVHMAIRRYSSKTHTIVRNIIQH